MSEEEKVTDNKKRHFRVYTVIHEYADKTTTYDTMTDIGNWEPKDNDAPLKDPNDTLYYYWTRGFLFLIPNKNLEKQTDLLNKILTTIYEFQAKVLEVDNINKERGLPLYTDGKEPAATDPNKEEVGHNFINVDIIISDDEKNLHYEATTDILKDGETPEKIALLYTYFANALAQCVTYLPSKQLQEHLASKICSILILADTRMSDAINSL